MGNVFKGQLIYDAEETGWSSPKMSETVLKSQESEFHCELSSLHSEDKAERKNLSRKH